MPNPFLIVYGVVGAVVVILIGSSWFGVSRRAVESELRRAERKAARRRARDGAARDDADIAA